MSKKNDILSILKENEGEFISSSVICEKLGITRAFVSKIVKMLKEDGYIISSSTKIGYKFQTSDVLNKEDIFRNLNFNIDKDNIIVLNTIDSTNNYAKSLLLNDENKGNYIIVAKNQTNGKGRQGKFFYSPKDKGIYMSLILNATLPIDLSLKITTATSVFIADAIKELFGIETKIKWINDIYLEEKKIVGILTEATSDFETKNIKYLIIGIGINIYEDIEKPDNIKDIMGFLSCEKIDRNVLIANICNKIFNNIKNIDNIDFIEKYKSYSMIINREITYLQNNKLSYAKAIDIDENGHLIIDEDGKIKKLSSGDITIRKIN